MNMSWRVSPVLYEQGLSIDPGREKEWNPCSTTAKNNVYKAVFPTFYNVLQPRVAFLFILRCSFQLWCRISLFWLRSKLCIWLKSSTSVSSHYCMDNEAYKRLPDPLLSLLKIFCFSRLQRMRSPSKLPVATRFGWQWAIQSISS